MTLNIVRSPALAALLVSATALTLSGQAQPALPPAPDAHVVTITPQGQTGSEPCIAVDWSDPNKVVAGAGGRWFAYSTDGARTFTPVEPAGDSGRSGGDCSLAFDGQGNVYLSFLWIEKNGLPGYWGHGPGANGIFVRRSPDGGKTWDEQETSERHWTGDEPNISLEDMPRIWSDQQANSPYKGNLYTAWIQWEMTRSVVLFSRSTDHGQTWSKPKQISTIPGWPRDDNGSVVGIIGTVAPDGTQYVIWNQGLNVTMAVSHDGGKTFAPSRPIFNVGPPYFGGAVSIPGLSRAMGFPQVGVDNQNGTLYVTWSDFRNGDVDVFIRHSTDHGKTWSPRMRVNNDAIHDGADQFLQWMAVDPIDGSVYVQFYDRRRDPGSLETRVTLARSTDGGKTFKNYAWTRKPFTGRNMFLGDYVWMTAYNGKVYGVWAEGAPQDYQVERDARGRAYGPERTPTIIKVGTARFPLRKH